MKQISLQEQINICNKRVDLYKKLIKCQSDISEIKQSRVKSIIPVSAKKSNHSELDPDTNYDTYIQVDPKTRIIALSDIHSDIQSLIIAFRDCAKVIQRKGTIQTNEILSDDIYRELSDLLQINLTEEPSNEEYPDNLNYEWIGDNTIIVLVGDIIDGKRMNQDFLKVTRNSAINYEMHEYPQIEIKILRFINALNKDAMSKGGRIYKLLGNHEIMNMDEAEDENMDNYIFDNDLSNKNYYNNVSRKDIFKFGNYGFNLLFQDSCRALLMINNYIFVHGQLIKDMKYIEYDTINIQIGNYINHINKLPYKTGFTTNIINKLNNPDSSQLWLREYGNLDDDKIRSTERQETKFCRDTVIEDFKSFLDQSGIPNIYPEDLKIVIGHCIQSNFTHNNNNARSYTNIIKQDHVIEILGPPSIYGNYSSNPKLIFGITMECPNHDSDNSHKIYKVDIGSSRGFDNMDTYNKIKDSSTKFNA